MLFRMICLALFIYAVWAAVYVGSEVANWAHAKFTSADVNITTAIR
jgi:hypothetical protein